VADEGALSLRERQVPRSAASALCFNRVARELPHRPKGVSRALAAAPLSLFSTLCRRINLTTSCAASSSPAALLRRWQAASPVVWANEGTRTGRGLAASFFSPTGVAVDSAWTFAVVVSCACVGS